MRVRVRIGQRDGEVRDFPVPVARAMLADGRAEPVDAPREAEPPPVILERVSAREDRGMPRGPRRRVR